MNPQEQAILNRHARRYLWARANQFVQIALPLICLAGAIFFMENPRHPVLKQTISYSALAVLLVMGIFSLRLFLYSRELMILIQQPYALLIALSRGAAVYAAMLFLLGRFGDQAYIWVFTHPAKAVALVLASFMAYLAAKISRLL